MIYTAANTFGDIEDCSVGDLGCGAGMLSIACSMLGSSLTIGFDVDEEALDNAWVNCRKLDIYDIDLVQTDVQTLQLTHGTVAMNLHCTASLDSYLHNTCTTM